MRRAVAIFVILWIGALGGGALEYWHNLEHAREDAVADASAKASGHPIPAHEDHNETNCPIHAQLHLPLLPLAWVPLLICLGLFVAFLTLIAASPISRKRVSRITCRGPPTSLRALA